MTIEIHDNIPFPSRGLLNYPVMKLELGQCFFVDAEHGTDDAKRTENTLRSFVSRQHKNLRAEGDDRRFKVSRYDENNLGVWRVR
jgi:hypothetical protein